MAKPWDFGWDAVLALATCFLTGGVFLAWRQLGSSEKNAAIDRTLGIIREWNNDSIQDFLRQLEPDSCAGDFQGNRIRYRDLYKSWSRAGNDFGAMQTSLGILSRLAEKMYILLSQKMISGEVVARHIGYEIFDSYYILQDVLLAEAQYNFDYLNYYYLILTLKPFFINLPDEAENKGLTYAHYIKPVKHKKASP